MSTKASTRDAARRQAILDAARECFLTFGYAKTSFEDIAKKADLSRPLIYRKFNSKEEILWAVLETMFEATYREAEAALAKPGSKREKLMAVFIALLLEPWREWIVDSPMGPEIYKICHRITPDLDARHRKAQLKYTEAVIGSKEASEVFLLAVDGLTQDMPSTKTLRRRLEVLIDRFFPK